MDLQEWLGKIREAMAVESVFGEPYEKDGVTVIPGASVRGGGGGGTSEGGDGGGFGVMARPAGAYVISGGRVTWQPAVDVTRIVLGAQAVALVALVVLRSVLKARAKAR